MFSERSGSPYASLCLAVCVCVCALRHLCDRRVCAQMYVRACVSLLFLLCMEDASVT